mmetsp:Transcript_43409/g.80880  ORF Transcript_43409/g.80880 Transcript_43409/m.80880 type:complete len:212 (+) Transcript_43409:153-788(+)
MRVKARPSGRLSSVHGHASTDEGLEVSVADISMAAFVRLVEHSSHFVFGIGNIQCLKGCPKLLDGHETVVVLIDELECLNKLCGSVAAPHLGLQDRQELSEVQATTVVNVGQIHEVLDVRLGDVHATCPKDFLQFFAGELATPVHVDLVEGVIEFSDHLLRNAGLGNKGVDHFIVCCCRQSSHALSSGTPLGRVGQVLPAPQSIPSISHRK